MKNLFKVFTVVAILVAASSCGKPKVELQKGEWKLMSMEIGGISMPVTANYPTITFNDSTKNVTGFSGCNSFFGEYKVDGEKLKINLVGMTQALCADPQIESNYMSMLKSVTSYEIDDEQLVLFDSLTNNLAILTQNKVAPLR